MNSAQSALGRLLWLLYRPSITHRLHMYPTPGWSWGMGVVRGCARAVPARRPSPLTPLLHNSSLQQSYLEKMMMKALYFSILSSIILWFNLICSTLSTVHIKYLKKKMQSDNKNVARVYMIFAILPISRRSNSTITKFTLVKKRM